MNITEDISDLIKADIISQETADKIRDYYKNKGGQSHNKLLIVFSILGAMLIGLGILLIIAHNWDELSRSTKTILAFLPLVIGQILCGFCIIKKQQSIAWKESSSAFLFFGVGASISLISQIYNLSGNLSSFLLLWMLLCLPIIYIMKSSIASLLYIAGISYYLGQTSYWNYPHEETYYYWLLLLLVLPHYYQLYKHQANSNFTTFHHWFIPISILIALGSISRSHNEFMEIAYLGLFGLFYSIGNSPYFKSKKSFNNIYHIIGSLGTSSLLLSLSFNRYWKGLISKDFPMQLLITSPEFIAILIIFSLTLFSLWKQKRNASITSYNPLDVVFLIFSLIFIFGLYTTMSVVLINILILVIGIFNIKKGAKLDHLGILNYGLLMITILVICRFFDSNLSYVIRGILFVSVGIGFFLANFLILKKRKDNG
jgi:uncharacterized membrane protein